MSTFQFECSEENASFAKRFWSVVAILLLVCAVISIAVTLSKGWSWGEVLFGGVLAGVFGFCALGFAFLLLEGLGVSVAPINFNLPEFARGILRKIPGKQMDRGRGTPHFKE